MSGLFWKPMKSDIAFKGTLRGTSYFVMVLIGAIFLTLLVGAMPAIKAFKIPFLYRSIWDPVKGDFGAGTFIAGTLLTSFTALLISVPFSFSISIILGEYYKRGMLSQFLRIVVDLLASVPSVVYGLWGVAVLVPLIRRVEVFLGVTPYGVGILTTSLILAIMILPYSTSIAVEVIKLVPQDLRYAGYGIGATRMEVILGIVFPYARSGVLAGLLLSLSRALGETMAVTMVIGNVVKMPDSIFSPGNTLASIIASQFTESSGSLHLAAMIELGLVLFVITTIINTVSHVVIMRLAKEK